MEYLLNNRIRIILTKKITDSLTYEEEIEFKKYINSNAMVRQYYIELKKVWELTEILAIEKKSGYEGSKEREILNNLLKSKKAK